MQVSDVLLMISVLSCYNLVNMVWGSFMYSFLRDHLPASLFHDIWLRFFIPKDSTEPSEKLKTKAIYMNLSTPIGVSSGIDLDAVAYSKLLKTGLGFVEIGPVCPASEYSEEEYYSITEDTLKLTGPFTTFGTLWVKKNLVKSDKGPRGVNIIPSRENIDMVPHCTDDDYVFVISKLYNFVDFFTVNLCPNKFKRIGYYKRDNRYKGLISKVVAQRNVEIGLFAAVETGIVDETEGYFRRLYTPVYVKVNANWEDLEGLVECCIENGIDGLIVGDEEENIEKSREILKKVVNLSKGQLEIISYGGIETGTEVLERIKMGAKLVQLYSILLRKGLSEYFRIHQELLQCLSDQNLNSTAEAFNLYNKSS